MYLPANIMNLASLKIVRVTKRRIKTVNENSESLSSFIAKLVTVNKTRWLFR